MSNLHQKLARNSRLGVFMTLAIGLLAAGPLCSVSQAAEPAMATPAAKPAVKDVPAQSFKTPEEASEALIAAAEKFDVAALTTILGSSGVDLVVTNDKVQDKNQSIAFATAARAKHKVVRDPKDPKTAWLNIGADAWPMPIPIVQDHGTWHFDTEEGRTEILYRRVGRNELDAIEACHKFVRAQNEYALHRQKGSQVNQYAQKIISSPGKQDGLVWRGKDGGLEGPLAADLANALAQGYTSKSEPVHGYYYKVLKGQGPYAPLGTLDYVIKGAMIGGFALIASPAEYEVTGVKSFIVSQDGVVYESDLGPKTLELFRSTDRFNPDMSWNPLK
jgi:hypothetical protein